MIKNNVTYCGDTADREDRGLRSFAGGRALTGGAHLILHKGSGTHPILRTAGSYSVGAERYLDPAHVTQ